MNTQNTILIFQIKNTQRSYASVLRFIQKVDKLKLSEKTHLNGSDLDQLRNNGISEIYRFFTQRFGTEEIMRQVPSNISRNNCLTDGMLERMENYIREVGTRTFRFVFVVDAKSSAEKFADGFQYLFTAWQEYKGRVLFLIDNDSGNRNATVQSYFLVSHQLLFSSLLGSHTYVDRRSRRILNNDQDSFYNYIYAWNYTPEKHLARLALNGKNMKLSSFTKFYPLLPIDTNSQSILAGTVHSFFPESWSYAEMQKMVNRQPVDILLMQNAFNGSRSISLEVLKAMCLKFLLESGELTTDDKKNNNDKKHLYDDMSMLAFFLYGLYLYYINKDSRKSEDLLSTEEKMNLICDVQDFAVGILQLTDNTVRHSSLGTGCLSVRILPPDFPSEHFKYLPNAPGQYFLEIRLIDSYLPDAQSNHDQMDKCIMREVFLNNLTQRISKDEFSSVDKDKVGKFREKFKNAPLSAFFNPKLSPDNPEDFSIADWDEYYEITENALHHYGLTQFNTIVKSHDGYFSVRSGTDYDVNPEYYYDTMGKSGNQLYLPGTQYVIMLPIRMKPTQYSTGLSVPDAETDFSSISSLSEKDGDGAIVRLVELWKECGDKNRTKIGNGLSDFFSSMLTDEEYIYTFDFAKLQQLDGKDGINSIMAREFFLKGLFRFIKTRFDMYNSKRLHLAFLCCGNAVMLEIVEMFCSFYNRNAKCAAMSNVDIYLSGEDPREEFIIAGENLMAAGSLSRRVCLSKGRFSPLQNVLTTMIRTRFPDAMFDSVGNTAMEKLIPYDLIIKTKDKKRDVQFLEVVERALATDLQGLDFGCCVNNIHVRVGSKIHITNKFYEAQELFHTSQYLSRFSYLVAKDIASSCNPGTTRIILVGYETYSELLVLSVENMLIDEFKFGSQKRVCRDAIGHVIYENTPDGEPPHLRTSINRKLSKDDKIVILVPINSTLSTHNKIKAALERDERFSASAKLGIFKNYGLILIRHGNDKHRTEVEEQYWDEIRPNEKMIYAHKLIEPPVKYYVSVSTSWHNPLLCKNCYPDNCVNEHPLIGTNKASVVPTYMLGLTDKYADKAVSDDLSEIAENALLPFSKKTSERDHMWFRKLFLEDNALMYGHFSFYGNDFQFYFNTERILDHIIKDGHLSKKLDKWLEALRHRIFPTDGTSQPYNIIIAPEHSQNSGWINYISQKLFKDSSDILHFDVLKEYRDNVKAKFSNITAIYNNLKAAGEMAEIHFHFVDASLCSGRTLARARSLIQSLFPAEAFNGESIIKVKLFDSVIVLLSRNSPDTQRSYVLPGSYYGFINLSIPNLRNHLDACILCNLVKEFGNLSLRAASNEIADEWGRREKKLSVTRLGNSGEGISNISAANERAYRRLLCSQQAYIWLSEMGSERNKTSDVTKMLWELCYYSQLKHSNIRSILKYKGAFNRTKGLDDFLNDKSEFHGHLLHFLCDPQNADKAVGDPDNYIEMLISYVKVFSRPFLIFRKSVIDASFSWRLHLLDALLSEPSESVASAVLAPLWACSTGKKYKLALALYKALLGGVTKNGSNFAIRKENYTRIIIFFQKKLLPLLDGERDPEEETANFINWYICIIKRLIDSNGDETKSLWLQILLLTGKECSEENLNVRNPELWCPEGVAPEIIERLYIENNRIIFDGTADIKNNSPTVEEEGSSVPYYLENYVSFIRNDYGLDSKTNPLFKGGKFSEASGQVYGMIELYRTLEKTDGSIKDYYERLSARIKDASGADSVMLLGTANSGDNLYSVKMDLRTKLINRYSAEYRSGALKREIDEITFPESRTPYAYIIGQSEKNDEASIFEQIQGTLCMLEDFDRSDVSQKTEAIGGSVALNKDGGYIIAKIDPNRKSTEIAESARIEPLYIVLYRKDKDRFKLLRGMRNILAFRAMFVKRLKLDFNNSLIQDFSLTREKAEYLAQPRAAGHTQSAIIDLLVQNLSNAGGKKNGEKDEIPVLRGHTIRALADQTCSHFYSEFVTQENGIDVQKSQDATDRTSLIEVIKALSIMKFEIISGEAQDLTTSRRSNLRLRDAYGTEYDICDYSKMHSNFDKVFLPGRFPDVLSMFVLLIINACRHGDCDAAEDVEINTGGPANKVPGDEEMDIIISYDGEAISVINPVLSGLAGQIAYQMRKSAYRRPKRDEGISLWVINEYFKQNLILRRYSSFDWSVPNLLEHARELMKTIRGFEEQCLIFEPCGDFAEADAGAAQDAICVKIPQLR